MPFGLSIGMDLTAGRSAAASFNPASLFTGGRLGYVLDPTATSSVYQDSARTTPGAVGSPVGSLSDLSGNGNHALQATAAKRPILVSNSGVQALSLDGVDDYLQLVNILASFTNGGTAIYAAKCAADPPTGEAGPVLGGFGSSGQANDTPFTDGVLYADVLSTTRKTCPRNGVVPAGGWANWHVVDFRSAANNWKAAYNGTDFFTTATNTVGSATIPAIGSSGQNSVPHFTGLVGRVFLIDIVLTGTPLANARTWVGSGAGLSI